jgi:hypothetical protein
MHTPPWGTTFDLYPRWSGLTYLYTKNPHHDAQLQPELSDLINGHKNPFVNHVIAFGNVASSPGPAAAAGDTRFARRHFSCVTIYNSACINSKTDWWRGNCASETSASTELLSHWMRLWIQYVVQYAKLIEVPFTSFFFSPAQYIQRNLFRNFAQWNPYSSRVPIVTYEYVGNGNHMFLNPDFAIEYLFKRFLNSFVTPRCTCDTIWIDLMAAGVLLQS